jgi:hypothetical protein
MSVLNARDRKCSMNITQIGTALMFVGLLVASRGPIQAAEQGQAPEKIFETNITNDLSIFSGEPEIAVDPTTPRNLAIIEFAIGSSKVPAYSGEPLMVSPDRLPDAMANNNRIMLSKDGGNTWTARASPLFDPEKSPISADPAIAYGPDGSLYADTVFAPKQRPSNPFDFSGYSNTMTVSRDGGKSFSKPLPVHMAPHRPFLRVDNRTGTVYLTTFGFDPSVQVQTDDSLQDGWLVAFKPDLAAHSEPRKFGGPDFSGSRASLTAANGVVATTFVLGLPKIESANRELPAPMPLPASLQGLIKDGTKMCSPQKPCIFFQTSTDEGQHWTRHHVPLPAEGFSGLLAFVAADPGRPGRYAVGLQSQDETKLDVLVTDDSGATWSGPHTIPEAVKGKDFKAWMDYGPTGVLGFMWKKQRDDLTPPAKAPANASGAWSPPDLVGAAFDVYAAISCDGGKRWLPPLRVNAVSSPPGPNRQDDLSHLVLDAHEAHLVWGDRRSISKVTNAPNGRGGVQVYYGRVPFSTASNGAKCGR